MHDKHEISAYRALRIAVELVTTGHYLDVAARDLVMATAAGALARLAQAVEAPAGSHPSPRGPRPAGAHA